MDIATLGIRVESGQIKEAGRDIERLGQRGVATQAQLQAALARTVAQIKAVQDAYRRGAIGPAQLVEDVRLLQMQADKTRRALASIPPVVGEVSRGMERGRITINALRSPLATLATQAIDARSSLGQLSSVLLTLGVGGPIAIGLLAGLAAIGVAMRKLTEDTRKAQEAYDKYMESLRGSETPLAIVGRMLDIQSERLRELERLALTPTGALIADPERVDAQRRKVKELQEQYEGLFRTIQGDAQRAADKLDKVLAVRDPGDAFARSLLAINASAAQDLEIALLQLQPRLEAVRNVLLTDPTQQGMGLAETAAAINAANRGGPSLAMIGLGGEPGRNAVEKSEQIRDSWADIARSALQMAQALGTANDSMILLLHNAVSFADQLEQAISTARSGQGLSTSNALGLLAGAGGILASLANLGGESPEERRRREVLEQNTQAIVKLTQQIGGFGLLGGTAAGDILGVRNAISNILDAISSGAAGPIASQGAGLLINRILAQYGLSMQDLKDVAEGLGISFANAVPTAQELQQVLNAIGAADLTQFRQTFTGQLEALRAEFDLFDITDPIQQLQRLRQLAIGGLGSPALGALAGADLTTAAGRANAEAILQDLFRRLNLAPEAGGLSLEELGGLSTQQFLEFLLEFEQLIDAANGSLTDAIESLRGFADSLKLDQRLTTLTPIQQYAEARRQYELLLQQAQAGDANAAARLPEAARAFLEASRAVNASGPQYAADFARVVEQTEALTRLFESQQDTQGAILEGTDNIVNNTQQTVERLEALIAVQAEGMQQLIDRLDAMRTEQAETVRATTRGFEGLRLNR